MLISLHKTLAHVCLFSIIEVTKMSGGGYMLKTVWSDFYGGMIDLINGSHVRELPEKARYKYTDEMMFNMK